MLIPMRMLAVALIGSLLSGKPKLACPDAVDGEDGDVLSVEVKVDEKMHRVAFRAGDDFTSVASTFCSQHGLDGKHSKSSTGMECPHAVAGLMEEANRKWTQQKSTRIISGRTEVGDIYVMPPKKTFPFKVSNEMLEKEVSAARVLGNGSPARLVISVYVFGHDASFVSMCDGNVLGVIELERLPEGRRYFDLAATARKGHDESERDAIVIEHISRAQEALAALTFSSTSKKHCGMESNKYDAGIIVDAQTPKWMQDLIKMVVPLAEGGSWATVNHHYSHALLGWYDSPYYFSGVNKKTDSDYGDSNNLTLILSYDGFGNDGSFCIFVADGSNDDPLLALREIISKPISMGQTYISVANLLPHFWSMDTKENVLKPPCPYEENPSCQLRLPGILMAYAALGRPRTEWRHGLRRFLVEGVYDTSSMPSQRQMALLDLDERGQRDFAATAQSVFEEVVVDEIGEAIKLVEQEDSRALVSSLVVTGGCALNVRANTVLQNRFRIPVYVPSSPGDCGIAIGGGWSIVPPPTVLESPGPQQSLEYLGAELWDRAELQQLVSDWEQEVRVVEPEFVADLLVSGLVGAVVRGRQEVGPRALGHRSLLAVPTTRESCNRMNRIKHRDWYRPCAPVLNEESVQKVFEVTFREGKSVTSSPYMSFAPLLRAEVLEAFPGIAHVDGTARPQTVSRVRNYWLHRLLSHVSLSTGMPILINTSFNTHGKPILNSAAEALQLLRSSTDLDFVVIEDFLFMYKKKQMPS